MRTKTSSIIGIIAKAIIIYSCLIKPYVKYNILEIARKKEKKLRSLTFLVIQIDLIVVK